MRAAAGVVRGLTGGALVIGCMLLRALAACSTQDVTAEPIRDAGSVTSPTPGFGESDSASASVDPFDANAPLANRVGAYFVSCSGGAEQHCHADGEAHLTMTFGDGGDVIGVPSFERPDLLRVKPFDPASSYLYLKVLGDGGIDGGRMPLDGEFDDRVPPLVGAWIEAGAPNPIY